MQSTSFIVNGRPVSVNADRDMPLLDALKATSMASNGSIKQVMLDLVKNAAFRTRVGGAP